VGKPQILLLPVPLNCIGEPSLPEYGPPASTVGGMLFAATFPRSKVAPGRLIVIVLATVLSGTVGEANETSISLKGGSGFGNSAPTSNTRLYPR
jgi:hypothetical protein